jgi:hypothetical protein
MPAKNPRLTAVLEKPLYLWFQRKAKQEGISLSMLVRDLLREAFEREEDAYWSRIGEERLKTYDPRKALTHSQIWGKNKLKKGRGNK